jgi:hypothetical protein
MPCHALSNPAQALGLLRLLLANADDAAPPASSAGGVAGSFLAGADDDASAGAKAAAGVGTFGGRSWRSSGVNALEEDQQKRHEDAIFGRLF